MTPVESGRLSNHEHGDILSTIFNNVISMKYIMKGDNPCCTYRLG